MRPEPHRALPSPAPRSSRGSAGASPARCCRGRRAESLSCRLPSWYSAPSRHPPAPAAKRAQLFESELRRMMTRLLLFHQLQDTTRGSSGTTLTPPAHISSLPTPASTPRRERPCPHLLMMCAPLSSNDCLLRIAVLRSVPHLSSSAYAVSALS